MARAGDVLENPATGERLVFRRTAAETGGDVLEYELTFRPRGFAAQPHLHPSQDEKHEVVSGSLGLVLNGTHRVLEAGDSVVVAAGAPHRVYAIGEEPVHAVFELRPALRSEELLERLFALAAEGKVNAKGDPSLPELARIAREYLPEGYATRPPLALQKVLFAVLAAFAGGGEYLFVDEWDAEAPIEAVFDALADGRTYTEWWKPVYIETETDGPPAVGRVSTQHFKGRLPYHLHTTSRIVALDRPRRVEADVEGDLRGKGIWTLTETAAGTHVRFDWRVFADKPLLRALTPVLRPVFRWNHAWAIARAREGLAPYAAARRGTDTP